MDAIRRNEKASFCVIDQDEMHGELYTTFFRSVIAFGRIRIIEDEEEKGENKSKKDSRHSSGKSNKSKKDEVENKEDNKIIANEE